MRKMVSLLMILVVMCTALCACQPYGQNSNQSDNKPSTENQETEKQAVTVETETANTEADIQVIPVDVETSGGVVIVGRIGFDEKGWHILPEQPLNIIYTYFMDNPSIFPAQTRISMLDPKDDGVDKGVYLGQMVTVTGTLRFVRDDFETVYLIPYNIAIGKIAEGSYGDSALTAPEGPTDLYDPTEPLPKYMDVRILDGKYIYNPFMLSEESLQLMGNDFAVFYCDFVDGILNYRSEIHCPEKSYAEMLGSVIYYDFPVFDACAKPYEFFKHYNSDTQTISVEYKYSAQEHQELMERFHNAADEMLATVTPDMTEVEKARNIYHELCTRMTYDDSALETLERKNSYYAYLHNSGVCVTFANVYNQLLTQLGIKATLATCEYDPTMGHVWSIVTLDGVDYFCDPTFELSYDQGNGYVYFGMSYGDRTENGLGQDGIRGGRYYTYPIFPEMIGEQSLH